MTSKISADTVLKLARNTVGLAVLDERLNLVECNEVGHSAFNIPPLDREIHFAEVLSFAGSRLPEELFAEALAGEQPQVAGRVISPSGDVPFRGALTAAPDADGSSHVALFLLEDPARSAAMSEARARARLMEAAYLVAECTPEGMFLSVNAAFAAAFARDPDDFAGEMHADLLHESAGDAAELERFWETAAAGQTAAATLAHVGPDGAPRWLNLRALGELGPDGEVLSVTLGALDVSDSRSDSRLADAVLDGVGREEGVLRLAMDRTVVSANARACEMLGLAPEDASGFSFDELLVAGAARASGYKTLWERLAKGSHEAVELALLRSDGGRMQVHCRHHPYADEAGRLVEVFVFLRDLSEEHARLADLTAMSDAIDKTQSVAEFTPNGRLLTANRSFLRVLGYELDELRGKPHRMLCDPAYGATPEYAEFWERLGRGDMQEGVFRHVDKNGQTILLRANYNPVLDDEGAVRKVLAFAFDITASRRRAAEDKSVIAAIDRSGVIIEFDLAGRVLGVNENFSRIFGLRQEDVAGQHHRALCDPTDPEQPRIELWERLNAGQYVSGEFKLIGAREREIWIEGAYNPVIGDDGAPQKVVLIGTDTTEANLEHAEFASRVTAVDRGLGVIEFDLDGNILSANDNFQRAVGYSLREMKGSHHSMLCSSDYVRSDEYREFWLNLAKGEFKSGRFHRIGKYDRDIYIQAVYSPILNLRGEVERIIKYAYDVTSHVALENEISRKAQQMSEAVDELARAIDSIDRASRAATDLSAQTQDNATEGAGALNSAMETIDLIQKGSTEMADIVRVIGEIAHQTNLLAFNAAIEAARAGEHGVGFSVVADEVRKLAERSSDAAREITKLIEVTVGRVNQGTDRSQHAQKAFERIVASVGKTGEAIQMIASSAGEQQAQSSNVVSLIKSLASDVRR